MTWHQRYWVEKAPGVDGPPGARRRADQSYAVFSLQRSLAATEPLVTR